jgi:acetyl esterase/lipase
MAALLLVLASNASGAPGDLILADPVRETPPGAQAWTIRYRTTSDRGAPIEASAMVVAPREAMPARPRRVIAWTHGTWGVVERCAPSLSANFFTATPGLTEAVRAGYVVVAPDYPGLGTPGPHPFLVGPSAARSTLDAVRAARSIAGAAAGDALAVWGESQGGHAALWTGATAHGYAPDLKLVGVAAAAPPTELVRNLNDASDPAARALMASYAAWSWSKHYGASLAPFGKRPLQNVMLRLAQNNCVELGKTPRLGTILGVLAVQRALAKVQFDRVQPWARLLRQNSAPLQGFSTTVMILQGGQDKLVNPLVTRDYARRLCAQGGRVRYVARPAAGHVEITRETVGQTLDWIGNRFGGQRAASDCRTL